MSSPSGSSSVLDIYTLEELQQMLTDPKLGTQLASTLVTPSKQQNISDQIREAEKLKQQTMRVKEDIIEPLECTINSAKKRPASSKTTLDFSPTPKQTKEQINVESNESN
eukprot:jgi/Psemu1/52576/gm1.52576_g